MRDARERSDSDEVLYLYYVQYMADAKQAMLSTGYDQVCWTSLRNIQRVVDFEEFRQRLAAMLAWPARYQELTRILRDGFAAQLRQERDQLLAGSLPF